MEDISISKSRGKKYLGGSSPMVPAFIVGDDPIPLNPPGSNTSHSPVTIGSPANGLSIVGQELSLGIGAGLSIDVDNKIQLGNDGAGVIDISDLVQFSNGLQIRGTVDQNETVQEFGLRGTINPDSGPFLALSYFESGTDYQASATFGLDDFVIEAINENGNSLIRVRDQINSKGLENAGDYEANFTARSLVTKQYVTSAISGAGHNPVTISGTPNGLSISGTQVLSLALSSAGVTGALSGTDWSTFNGKLNLTSPITGYVIGANTALAATDTILGAFGKIQGQIGARVSGTIASGQVAFGTGVNTVGGSTVFVRSSNGRIGVGITNPDSYSFNTNTAGLLGVGDPLANGFLSIISSPTSIGYLAFADGTSGDDRFRGSIEYSHSVNAMYFRTNAVITGLIASNGRWLLGSLATPTDTLDVNGTTRIRTISNAVGNFLTTSATGVVQQRTAGELASDIGAVTITGTQNITGAKTFDNSLLVLSGTSPIFRIAGVGNVSTLNFRANNTEEKATLEFNDLTKTFTVKTNVSNADIAITPHGTGKIKLANVPSGSGDVLMRDASNNLVLGSGSLVTETKGTFTPVLKDGVSNSFSATVSEANYTKIGTVVHFSIFFTNIESTGFTPSSYLNITGLPFSSPIGYNYNGVQNINKMNGCTLTTLQITELAVYENSGILFFQKVDSPTLLTGTDFTTGNLAVSGSYMI